MTRQQRRAQALRAQRSSGPQYPKQGVVGWGKGFLPVPPGMTIFSGNTPDGSRAKMRQGPPLEEHKP